MAKRKGWDNLDPVYRRRFERRGVTRAMYEDRTFDIAAARGHTSKVREAQHKRVRARAKRTGALTGDYQSETRWADLAKALFVGRIEPKYILATPHEQEIVGEWWVKGFMTTGPADEERKADRRYFLDWYADQNNGQEFGSEEWKMFRDFYRMTFS